MSWIDDVATKVEEGTVFAGGGVGESVIASAEAEIGPLPSDYRRFITEFGFVRFRSNEVFGLADGIPPYLDVVKVTLAERQDSPGFPVHGIVVMNDGGGNLYYLDGESPTESPVRIWYHDTPDDIEVVAPSFSEWLIDLME